MDTQIETDHYEEKLGARRSNIERSASSIQSILNAALICFNRSGYQDTSTEDIAREAGVSKGLLHYHFKSKEHILLEVQNKLFRRLSDEIQAASRNVGPSIKQALWALDELWAILRRGRPIIPVMLDLIARSLTRPELKKRLEHSLEEQRQLLISSIRAVLGPTQEQIDVSADGLAEILMASIAGLCTNMVLSNDPRRQESAFEDLKRLLVRALAPTFPKEVMP